ncbi:hypothetical protein [Streptomyces sp. NPDC091215]|uniref:hypothetical protein n=1 Tax=Streptomyces sp. NPDC091215 TaxID=3155192 RepID=UPI0034183C61
MTLSNPRQLIEQLLVGLGEERVALARVPFRIRPLDQLARRVVLELRVDGRVIRVLPLIHVIFSGVFKQYPNLRLVVGHLGEAPPF